MSEETTEKQNKFEIKYFKKHYLAENLNANGSIDYYGVSYNQPNSFDNLVKALIQCKDFERPDGYFFDEQTLTLYIFEHFTFDCSKTNRNGSSLRRNIKKADKEIKCELNNLSQEYNSVKIIAQGEGVQNGNTIVFNMGADGDKYRNNYIKSFKTQYENHSMKVQEYIANCKQEIKTTPNKIITAFVIEDVTLGGTYFKNQNTMGEPVNLLLTKQFLEIFRSSKIDYVIFGNLQSHDLTICDRSIANDDLSKYIDLNGKEFFIFPAMPKITVAHKISLKNQ